MATGNRYYERSEAVSLLAAVLPVTIERLGSDETYSAAGQTLRLLWLGDGTGATAAKVLEDGHHDHPVIVAARSLTQEARELLTAEGISWVVETGEAQIQAGPILVERGPLPATQRTTPVSWTPSMQAVAEAILLGTTATVSATSVRTGLSVGTCSSALRFMLGTGLLEANAARGRNSARELSDPWRMLNAYAAGVRAAGKSTYLRVGAESTAILQSLQEASLRWESIGIEFAVSGTAGAQLLAPYSTRLSEAIVYMRRGSVADLHHAARLADLRPLEGGRLTLAKAPSDATLALSAPFESLPVAPWPRVYADLLGQGVRGDDLANHLAETRLGESTEP